MIQDYFDVSTILSNYFHVTVYSGLWSSYFPAVEGDRFVRLNYYRSYLVITIIRIYIKLFVEIQIFQ